jgi:hypothetical protein
MSEKRIEFFFSYKNGNSRQISKEEWEKEWLEWWLEKHSVKEDAEEAKARIRQ